MKLLVTVIIFLIYGAMAWAGYVDLDKLNGKELNNGKDLPEC